jgi:hypothetical protein
LTRQDGRLDAQPKRKTAGSKLTESLYGFSNPCIGSRNPPHHIMTFTDSVERAYHCHVKSSVNRLQHLLDYFRRPLGEQSVRSKCNGFQAFEILALQSTDSVDQLWQVRSQERLSSGQIQLYQLTQAGGGEKRDDLPEFQFVLVAPQSPYVAHNTAGIAASRNGDREGSHRGRADPTGCAAATIAREVPVYHRHEA